MCLVVKNGQGFTSPLLNHKSNSSFTPSIDKVVFPDFIENTDEVMFEKLVIELSNKYASKNYKNLEREDLYKEKGWSDLEVLCLLKFYANNWSIQVPDQKEYFPSFVFTYNVETLMKEIESTIAKANQVIKPLNIEMILKKRELFTALDITYLLRYFVISDKDYIE